MDRAIFYRCLRARSSGVFGTKLTQDQVVGLEGTLDGFTAFGDGYRDTLAYGLATNYHETGARMVPVREGFARTDAGARRAVENLAAKRGPKSAVAKYAKPAGPYGHVYYGRGIPQLTWHENYVAASEPAGVDLEKYPDLMLDPVISARVLFWGIMTGRWNGRGKGIRYYAEQDGDPDMDFDDLVEARRTVNVQDKAVLIAGYAKDFELALITAGFPDRVLAAAAPRRAVPAQVIVPREVALGREKEPLVLTPVVPKATSQSEPAAVPAAPQSSDPPRFGAGWFVRLIGAAFQLLFAGKAGGK